MRRILKHALRRVAFPSAGLWLSRRIRCEAQTDLQQQVQTTMSKIFFAPDECEHTELKIFALNADQLGYEIAAHLDISLGRHQTKRFADGQISMAILDSVSGHKVFIIKSFENQKINDGVMELLLAISCMKKSGAASIVAIIPYFPYSKMETSTVVEENQVSTFFAADIAKMIEAVGCDMIITMNGQQREMKGFTGTQCSFINIDCTELVVPCLVHKEIQNPILVGTSLNPFVSKQLMALKNTFGYFDLNCDLGFYHSDRYVGSEVAGRDVILFQNIIRTGQKLLSRAKDLKSRGARQVYAFVAHGLCQSPEFDKLLDELPVNELILTNTVHHPTENSRLRYLSVSKYLAELISVIDRTMPLEEFRHERGILKMAFVEKIRRYSASSNGHQHTQKRTDF